MEARDFKMYDLHGLSETQSELRLYCALREASINGENKIRFVTGRGNHVNSKGNRGTLFKEFPTWLKNSKFADRIDHVEKGKGHYVVHLSQAELDGRRSKGRKDFRDSLLKENLPNIKIAAKNNDPDMMWLYANLLEEGILVKQNLPKAVELIKEAAHMNYPPCMHEYARYWLHGIGIKQSDKKAQTWLWKAHKAGYIPSTVTLAKSYALALPGYKYDIDKAIELHTIAANAGNTDSMRFFGTIHRDGAGVEHSETKSFEWYKRAADKGDAKAQFNAAVMLTEGIGCDINLSEAERYMGLSAKGGDADAQYQYSSILSSKVGKRSKDLGFMWLITAADNGSEQANAYMSTLLKNSDLKNEHLQRSANAGNLLSKIKLDKLNGLERTVEEIPLSEITEMFMLLEDNDILNMEMHAKYLLLDRILLEAKQKYKRSAYGYIEQMTLGNCTYAYRRQAYFRDRGDGALAIKKNKGEVLRLLEIACKLDDPIAMLQLGLHYQREKGNNRSIIKAKTLIRQAAEKKYPPAFYFLGMMYEQGFFGENKWQHALTCYKSAVKYEQLEGHVAKFVMGPMDEYESVLELAKRKVLALGKIVKPLKASRKTSSTIKTGFFSSPEKEKQGVPLKEKFELPDLDEIPQKKQSPPQDNVERYKVPIQNANNAPVTNNGFFGSFFSTRNVDIAKAVVTTAAIAVASTVLMKNR